MHQQSILLFPSLRSSIYTLESKWSGGGFSKFDDPPPRRSRNPTLILNKTTLLDLVHGYTLTGTPIAPGCMQQGSKQYHTYDLHMELESSIPNQYPKQYNFIAWSCDRVRVPTHQMIQTSSSAIFRNTFYITYSTWTGQHLCVSVPGSDRRNDALYLIYPLFRFKPWTIPVLNGRRQV